jgi:hypothetical protein
MKIKIKAYSMLLAAILFGLVILGIACGKNPLSTVDRKSVV